MVLALPENCGKAGKKRNHVIVGRGAGYFLRDRPEVFRVFLYASRTEKIKRLAADGLKPEQAAALLDRMTKVREAFVRHYFGKFSHLAYDLMVSTGTSGQSAVETILVCMQRKEAAQRAEALPQEDKLWQNGEKTAMTGTCRFFSQASR